MGELSVDPGLEPLFWLIFERSTNPIALLDQERRFVDLNDSAVALLGVGREELIGRSIAENITVSQRAAAEEAWREFLKTGDYTGTRALLTADGSHIDVEFAARLGFVDGRHLAVYVTIPLAEPGLADGHTTRGTELPLTAREREVTTLIALGDDTDAIARKLHVSPQTVRTHVRNAMGKLGAHTRAQLVAIVLCSEGVARADQLRASP